MQCLWPLVQVFPHLFSSLSLHYAVAVDLLSDFFSLHFRRVLLRHTHLHNNKHGVVLDANRYWCWMYGLVVRSFSRLLYSMDVVVSLPLRKMFACSITTAKYSVSFALALSCCQSILWNSILRPVGACTAIALETVARDCVHGVNEITVSKIRLNVLSRS